MYGQLDDYTSYGARNPAAFDLLSDAFGAIDATYAIDEIDLIEMMDEDEDEDFGLFPKARARREARKRGRRIRKKVRGKLKGGEIDPAQIQQRISVLEGALQQPGRLVSVERAKGKTRQMTKIDIRKRLKMLRRALRKSERSS